MIRSSVAIENYTAVPAGMMHDEHGYWVEDEDTEEQGFLSNETDHIWSYDEKADKWSSALAANRFIRNKRKRKRGKIGSGKGKTRKRKRPFRGGFKSYRYRSAAAHLVCLTEFEDQLEEALLVRK